MKKIKRHEQQEHLLTPELKEKVNARIQHCIDVAEKHHKVKLPFPEVRYDIRTWMGGLAYHPKNLIRLNLILLVENEDHYIEHTVAHEAAHLITRSVVKLPEGRKRILSHGKEWRSTMELLGLPPEVKHHYDCSSIEKRGYTRRPKEAIRLSKVQRLLKQVWKLSDDEQNLFLDLLNEGP